MIKIVQNGNGQSISYPGAFLGVPTPNNYFSLTRNDIVDLLPDGENKILEIGCGFGHTLIEAKKRGKASEIVGVEINDFEVSGEIDRFILGNIEEMTLPYPDEYFDVIICADVLEHLRDPWNTIVKIVSYAKTDGLFIASIPNVREIKTLYKIMIKGDFKYADIGILDKTHLRFFCKKNIVDLITQSGLKVTAVHPRMGGKRPLWNRLMLGTLEEFLAVQYIILAKKL